MDNNHKTGKTPEKLSYAIYRHQKSITPWIPDSRYWIPDLCQWNLDFIFQSRESGFYKQKFPGFWNPNSFTWGERLLTAHYGKKHNNTSAFSDELNVRSISSKVLRTYTMNSEQVYTDWHYVYTNFTKFTVLNTECELISCCTIRGHIYRNWNLTNWHTILDLFSICEATDLD